VGVIVKLEKVIEALEYPEEFQCYLDRNTGEVISITENEAPYVEGCGDDEDEEDIADLPQWQRDSILEVRRALESADLLALPSKFDLNEWDIMRRFSSSQPEPARGHLLDAIRGTGAFRLFRKALELLELRDEWFRFRDDAVRQFAMDWLTENGIAFTAD
jgi:hypothetical protein